MSKEAEDFHKEKGNFGNWMKFAEAYHNFAREKELSSLTDEVIEGIVKGWGNNNTDEAFLKIGAKMLRDYLKQNKPIK